MSTVAASAAKSARVPGARRRRLRSVPEQAGPSAVPGAGNPLQLERSLRGRLAAAVRFLVDDPAVVGLGDVARMLLVIAVAKANWERGGVTRTSAPDLARWLGVSVSTIDKALAGVRRAGLLVSEVRLGGDGLVEGLDIAIPSLVGVRCLGGVPRHPLVLSRAELATLLRLCEALFGPGWVRADGSGTPPGLLAGRRGRGAATDRLALLRLVLEARADGRVRLCGGAVDRRRGRPAVTVARLLGCTAAGGEKVLARLEGWGVVVSRRRGTGSGLRQRSQVLVPAVAAAQGGGPWPVPAPREIEQPPGAEAADPAAAADGGQVPVASAPAAVSPQVTEVKVPVAVAAVPEVADPAAAAGLHTDHALVVGEGKEDAGSRGFSGVAAGGIRRRPKRAGAREDRPADGQAGGRLKAVDGGGGPLRGEKPEDPTDGQRRDRGAAAQVVAGGRAGGVVRSTRVPRPPKDLERVLASVEALWGRLERGGARARVVAAVRAELGAVAGLAGAEAAGGILAARLARRLQVQGGAACVADPVGWLLRRGLPRRAECGDVRCDEGGRIDTGADCQACQAHVADRRFVRHGVAVQVGIDLFAASAEERRVETERRLREVVAQEVGEAVARREEAGRERAAREAALTQARADIEAAERARQAQPCADCGTPGVAGLCEPCGNWRATDAMVARAVESTVVASTDLADPVDVEVVAARIEAGIRADLDRACTQARAEGANGHTLSVLARLAAETAAIEHDRSTLAVLADCPEAASEARQAYEAEMRGWHRYPTRQDAREAAHRFAHRARARTAEHLLASRLTKLRSARPVTDAPVAAEPDPYAVGAARARAAMRAPQLVGA